MIDLKQKELNDWQIRNFGKATTEHCALGMSEEVGELCHFILKRKQGIREAANGNDVTNKIADAVADTIIFGIQLLSCEGLDAEKVISDTINEVLKRDFKANPSGQGYSQHKQ